MHKFHDTNKKYTCKTRIICVPFVSRISQPWRLHDNNWLQIYFSSNLLVQAVKMPKLRAAKIKGSTVCIKYLNL